MSFIFYDTETTGTQVRFDQILQFAAIRTGDDLNPIDTFEIRSRLQRHVLANPAAMNVTGISVSKLHDPSLPSHYEMCQQIQKRLTDWSPATFIGYNSIRFDEEILRSAFYQSLLPIYLTNTRGNSRFDILKVARTVHRYLPDAMNWPQNGNGKTSFKLDQLAPANGFNHSNAHDALADVEATIFIAKLIRQKAPEIWDLLYANRTKKAATDLLLNTPIVTVTGFARGTARSIIATAIDINPDHDGQVLIFNLVHDPGPLAQMSDEELKELVAGKGSPVTIVRVNSGPVLLPLEIAGDQCEGCDLGRDELVRRADILRKNSELQVRLVNAWLDCQEPYPPSEEVEEQIFDGFYERQDEDRIAEFHKASWDRRFEIAHSFEDPRLKTLARRLIYNEAPETLPAELGSRIQKAVADRLLADGNEGRVPWTTFEKVIRQAERLLEGDPGNELVREHLAEIRKQRDECASLAGS